jgi:UTP--glucose-1-phosphate uridylyltransferase
MIRKVVVPAAGLGTRLFPATKEQPKEMLPIFSRGANGNVGVKPLLQVVFEQLYNVGFHEFCFVVGRDKRSIEDHFTPDHDSIVKLKNGGRKDQASDLNGFYVKLGTSTIFWVNQPEPKGFGDAVLLSKPFAQDEPFLVHAGDTYIFSENAGHLSELIRVHERLDADASFLVEEVEDPKQYGVVEGDEVERGVYKVKRAVEKPEKPATNLAIVAIYAFNPVVFRALEKTAPGKGGEIQLTDAIQTLVNWGLNVYAVQLDQSAVRLDIGSPETYWEALSLSYQGFLKRPEVVSAAALQGVK